MAQRVVDSHHRARVADLAIDDDAGAAKARQSFLEPAGGDRTRLALGPREVFFGRRRRHDEVELAWSGAGQVGDLVEQLGATDGLVGDDQIGRHRSPFEVHIESAFEVDIGPVHANSSANVPD